MFPPAFIRDAGTVHSASASLISSHSAPSTSPVRAAVRIRNSKGKPGQLAGPRSTQARDEGGHFGVGQRRVMLVALGLLRQATLDAFDWIVASAMARRLRPVEHGADPLPHSPCRLWLGQPDRRQHPEHVRGVQPDQPIACQGGGGRRCARCSAIEPHAFRFSRKLCDSAWTCSAASANVGTVTFAFRRSASGSPPSRACLRKASAFSRASASETTRVRRQARCRDAVPGRRCADSQRLAPEGSTTR